MSETLNPTNLSVILYRAFGPQGWWPLPSRGGQARYDSRGYHPGVYGLPNDPEGIWEVCCGSVLTQNTAWTNVETALLKLSCAGVRSPAAYLSLERDERRALIRSTGYYNQKEEKLAALATFLLEHPEGTPSRDLLLGLRGVGPETADSMLLYAWHCPQFVVDAYTIRVYSRTGLIPTLELPANPSKRYEHVCKFITSRLSIPEKVPIVHWYQEYHALLVRLAKDFCRSRPLCGTCPLQAYCPKLQD